MNQSRWKIALATAALCIVSPSLSPAFPRPSRAGSVRRLQAEVDQLRSEIAALKAQVARLERAPSQLSIDLDGTVRDAAGRPVGYWGVDGPHQRSESLR